MFAWKVCLCAVILALSSAFAQATMIDSFGAVRSIVVCLVRTADLFQSGVSGIERRDWRLSRRSTRMGLGRSGFCQRVVLRRQRSIQFYSRYCGGNGHHHLGWITCVKRLFARRGT